MALTTDNRQKLADRVQLKVAGRGISRRAIVDAVDRVADALAASPAWLDPSCACSSHPPEIVAVVSSASMPDLASRVRDALSRDAIRPLGTGAATVGRHTVVTLRVPSGSEAAIRNAVGRLGDAVSVQFAPATEGVAE
jgi:hypothetical protein